MCSAPKVFLNRFQNNILKETPILFGRSTQWLFYNNVKRLLNVIQDHEKFQDNYILGCLNERSLSRIGYIQF